MSSNQPAPDLIAVPAAARERWADLVRVIERARDAYYTILVYVLEIQFVPLS